MTNFKLVAEETFLKSMNSSNPQDHIDTIAQALLSTRLAALEASKEALRKNFRLENCEANIGINESIAAIDRLISASKE